jgi:hypothetical protein
MRTFTLNIVQGGSSRDACSFNGMMISERILHCKHERVYRLRTIGHKGIHDIAPTQSIIATEAYEVVGEGKTVALDAHCSGLDLRDGLASDVSVQDDGHIEVRCCKLELTISRKLSGFCSYILYWQYKEKNHTIVKVFLCRKKSFFTLLCVVKKFFHVVCCFWCIKFPGLFQNPL